MKALTLTLLLASTFAYADAASDAIRKQQAAVSASNAAIARANSDALSEVIAIGAEIYKVPATREAVMAARKAQKFPLTLAANGFSDDAQLQGADPKTLTYNKAVSAAQEAYHNACPIQDPNCIAAARTAWANAITSAGHFCFQQPTAATIAAAREGALKAGTGCKP